MWYTFSKYFNWSWYACQSEISERKKIEVKREKYRLVVSENYTDRIKRKNECASQIELKKL